MIARKPVRFGIEHRLAVHEEAVVMMAVIERHLDQPGSVGLAPHRVRSRVPIVEIARQRNVFRVRREADKVHGFGHFPGRIPVLGNSEGKVRAVHRLSLCFQTESLPDTPLFSMPEEQARRNLAKPARLSNGGRGGAAVQFGWNEAGDEPAGEDARPTEIAN